MMHKLMTRVQNWIERWVKPIQGSLTLIGIILAIIPMMGQTTEAGAWAVFAGYVGIAILVSVIVVSNLLPSGPKKLRPWEHMEESITLDKMRNLDPRPVRIAVLGEKNTGKSTFIQSLRHNLVPSQIGANRPDPRLWVISLSHASNSHAVLFDVDGSSATEENKVLPHADHFIYFFDNHRDPLNPGMQQTRMKNAGSDLDQFLTSYETLCVPRLETVTRSPSVLLVMNKKDLWGEGKGEVEADGEEGPTNLEKATTLLCQLVKKLVASNRFAVVSSELHSNFETESVTKLANWIRKLEGPEQVVGKS